MSPSVAPQQADLPSRPENALADGLKPALKGALSSLNIQLDQELVRYRYAKRGEARPTKAPHFLSRRRSLNLIGEHAQSTRSHQSTPGAAMPPPPPPNPRLREDSEQTKRSVLPLTGAIAPTEDTATSTSEVAALRSALVTQPTPTQNEYLASSEALLDSFSRTEPGPIPDTVMYSPKSRWVDHLNTPLGLGALMLLLVASAGFGFVLVNPVAVRHLVEHTPLARIWPDSEEDANAEENSTDSSDDISPDAVQASRPPNPLSPDLSQKEFTNLDLNSLSTLPSETFPASEGITGPTSDDDEESAKSQPETGNVENAPSAPRTSQNATPKAEIPTTTTIPRTTTPPPSRPAPSAAPTSNQPTPQSATTSTSTPPAAPATVTTGNANGDQPVSPYYVVTDYTGDPSLATAREAVEDAYVRNFETGARIQLGAFSSEEAAATLVEELQTQGINAEVQTP